MGEMRDSDWSRPNLLRSDWLPIIGAIMTTEVNQHKRQIGDLSIPISINIVVITITIINFAKYLFFSHSRWSARTLCENY